MTLPPIIGFTVFMYAVSAFLAWDLLPDFGQVHWVDRMILFLASLSLFGWWRIFVDAKESDKARISSLKALTEKEPHPIAPPPPSPRAYLCGTAWLYELGEDAFGTKLYPADDASIVEHMTACLKDGCGVVEVEVRFVRWIKEPTL